MLKEDEAGGNARDINRLTEMEAPWRPFPLPDCGLIRLCPLKTLVQQCHETAPLWGMVNYTVI